VTSTGQKWLYGCGISCGLIVILSVLIVGGCFLYLKNATEDFEGLETRMETVNEQYGEISDFRPPADGTLAPERLEAFLAARAMMAPNREELGRTIETLSEGDDDESQTWRDNLFKVKSGLGLIPQFIGFFGDFSEALLASEMGQGEYYYIYTVSYYSWLGFSPGDGPPFKLTDKGATFNPSNSEADIHEQREEQMRRFLNQQLLPMLEGQLVLLDSGEPVWRDRLATEIAALKDDALRLPWQDGLPEQLELALDPFRDRFVDSYDALSNSIEILFQHR
jgi:hypothetical protein